MDDPPGQESYREIEKGNLLNISPKGAMTDNRHIRVEFTPIFLPNRQDPEKFVPEGHSTIAQRFNAGVRIENDTSPEGTAEPFVHSAVPSGLVGASDSLPSFENAGLFSFIPSEWLDLWPWQQRPKLGSAGAYLHQ